MSYLNFYEFCQKRQKKKIVIKPIISLKMNLRCQIDLIDMENINISVSTKTI